jgi:hypothetical protein
MIEKNIILLILNCEKYKYKAVKQKETWIKEYYILNNLISIDNSDTSIYFHIIGNPNLQEEFLFNINDNILYIKVEDDYNSLPKKILKSFQAINTLYKFKYIFKTDDDQQLLDIKFLINLQKLLLMNWSNENKRIHYGGQVITINKPYLSQYNILHPELPKNIPLLNTKYCSGRFYLLSSMAVKYLITKEKDIIKEFLEDYAIGYNLHEIFKKNIINLQTNNYFIDFIF